MTLLRLAMAVRVHSSEKISTPQENILSILRVSCSRLQRCECDFTAIFKYQRCPASSILCLVVLSRVDCLLSSFSLHIYWRCADSFVASMVLESEPLGQRHSIHQRAFRAPVRSRLFTTIFAVGKIMFLRKPPKNPSLLPLCMTAP